MATALLALATGLCLFDQDEGGAVGHMTPPDLCLGLLLVSVAIVSVVRLTAVGWAFSAPLSVPFAASLHVPDPPPKSAVSV